jgi:putative holliday junction resolvase
VSTWLGIDVGTVTHGVAVGNTLTQSARPLTPLAATPVDACWKKLDGILQEWKPAGVVVGLPIGMDGSEQRMSTLARIFARDLADRTSVPVVLMDERNSSKEAARVFADKRASGQSKRKQGAAVDAWAAALILERYLQEHAAKAARAAALTADAGPDL